MTALFPHMDSSSNPGSVRSCASSSDISCSPNGRSSDRVYRRKWVLEKWLIWITFLVTSILLDSAYGDVMCYECAWQGSSPLPSTSDGVSDVCRPHNFNVDVVHKIKCPNGCKKQALYEFENDPAGPKVDGAGSNANNTNGSRVTLENMTFYLRGCQDDKKTRENCENKSFHNQVYALECVCLTDYCNGERSSGASSTFFRFFAGLPAPSHRNNIQGNLGFFNSNVVELSIVAFLINYLIINIFPTILKQAQ